MCWSATVSLNTFVVALFGATFALANGADAKLVAWMLCFSTVQLVEYFIWTHLRDPARNALFSSLGLLVLVAEPVFSIALMPAGAARAAAAVGYAAFCALVLALYAPWRPHTTVAPNGHLRWHWLPPRMPLALCLVWAAFFLVPLLLAGYRVAALVGVATMLVSLATYLRADTWGSMWCWIANLSWLAIIGFIALNRCFGRTLCGGAAPPAAPAAAAA